jgi:hypothetical protein
MWLITYRFETDREIGADSPSPARNGRWLKPMEIEIGLPACSHGNAPEHNAFPIFGFSGRETRARQINRVKIDWQSTAESSTTRSILLSGQRTKLILDRLGGPSPSHSRATMLSSIQFPLKALNRGTTFFSSDSDLALSEARFHQCRDFLQGLLQH